MTLLGDEDNLLLRQYMLGTFKKTWALFTLSSHQNIDYHASRLEIKESSSTSELQKHG
jgi:hypothetical protein